MNPTYPQTAKNIAAAAVIIPPTRPQGHYLFPKQSI